MFALLRLWLLCITLLIASVQPSLNSALTNISNHTHNIADSYIFKAKQSIHDENYQTAMQVFEKAIFIKNITDIKLYNSFGVLLMDKIQNYTYTEKIFNLALSLGNTRNATDDLDELAYVYHNMGMCQMFLGNFNQSRLMFEQSIEMNRSVSLRYETYYKLGELFCNHFNDYANAIKMLEKVLELDNTNVQACMYISEVLLSLDHQFTLEKSQELFDRIIGVLGNDCGLYNDFGVMILQTYDAWTDARAIFVKSLTFDTSANAWFNLAIIDERNGNYTSAVLLFEQAISLDPLYMDGYLRLANLLIQVFENYHTATQHYISALMIEPENNDLWEIIDEMLNQRKITFEQLYTLINNTNNVQLMLKFGTMLVDQKARYAAARSILLKCIAIDSWSCDAWYYLGVVQAMLKQYNQAITSLNNSIQLYPHWNAYHLLGSVYSEISGNVRKAQKMFETAIELAPDDTLSPAENSDLASCHFKLGLALQMLYSANESQQLKAMYHYEQSISIDPQSCAMARFKYATGLLIRGFDVDAAIETIKDGLKINPNDDLLLGILASMQTVMNKTDQNTIQMFQKAIYQLNTSMSETYLEYAKYTYLFHKQPRMNHENYTSDKKTVQEIETMLHKAIHSFSLNGSNSKDESYHQLALLKMQTLSEKNNESISFKYQQVMKIYQQGLNELPNSCLLHVGKAYLLQNDHFKQYNQSVKLYKTAIQLCRNYAHNTCRVMAMLNLASLLIDQYPNSHVHNYSQYLIKQGCIELIKALNGAIFFVLENEWVGDFESTMIKFVNTNLIDVDKSLIHETLGLYYQSLNLFEQALMQFILSIHHNDKNNSTNDLIMVSYWKIGKIYSRHSKNSNITTTKILKHFSIAVDQASRAPTIWKKYQLSELYYDFGYFLNTKMNDVWNATRYYLKSIELNPFNIKAKEQLDQTIDKNENVFSQFDECTLCLGRMIDSFQSIHTNNCTHRFHTNCINKWYQKTKEKACPLCREPQP